MAAKRTHETESERDGRHWDAVAEAGELLVERRFEDALVEVKRVLSEDPNNPYAYNVLGNAFWELRRFEAARDAYRAAVLLAPSFVGARVALAHALRKLGDRDAAEREARMVLRQAPDDGEAHHVLGLILASRGNRRQARTHLEKFLASKPELEAQLEARSALEMLSQGEEGEALELDEQGDEDD